MKTALFSKEREGRGGVDIFALEFVVRHAEHQDSLDEGDDTPASAGHERDEDRKDAAGGLAEYEILDAECADKNCKQASESLLR